MSFMRNVGENLIQVEPDHESMVVRAVQIIVTQARLSIHENGFFTLVLSGGKTPIPIYEKLALSDLPWSRVHLFWGDERPVPIDSPENNFRMVQDHLISKIQIPSENIHRIYGELKDLKEVTERYEGDIRQFFKRRNRPGFQFNLILLGLGEEGHTASLFPGTGFNLIPDVWITSFWIEKLKSFRITMLPRLINKASLVVVLVSGSSKSEIVKKVLEGQQSSEDYPILKIQPENGKLIWLMDTSAASQLSLKS